jgi:hypothetical protein
MDFSLSKVDISAISPNGFAPPASPGFSADWIDQTIGVLTAQQVDNPAPRPDAKG